MQQRPPDPRERPLNPNLSSTYSKFGNQPQYTSPEQYQQPQYPYPQSPPQYTPPPKKKMSFGKFLAIGCGGLAALVILIIVIVAAASAGSNSTNTASQATQPAQATQAAQPTQKPESTAQQISDLVQQSGMLGSVATTYGYTNNPQAVVIKDNIGDGNLTNGLTVGEIHLECFTAQKALWTSTLKGQITEVLVQVSMNVVDQYGNNSNQMVATCDLTSGTAQRFNWSNLDQDSAWQDYDNTSIAPFLNS